MLLISLTIIDQSIGWSVDPLVGRSVGHRPANPPAGRSIGQVEKNNEKKI